MRKIDMFKKVLALDEAYEKAARIYGNNSRDAELAWCYYRGAIQTLQAAELHYEYHDYKMAHKKEA